MVVGFALVVGSAGATVHGHGWYAEPVFVPVEAAIDVLAPLLQVQ